MKIPFWVSESLIHVIIMHHYFNNDHSPTVPRIQFLAIEIARNKAGLNSVHYSQLQRL